MRTPLFLLALFLALVGGGLAWLAIAGPPPAAPRGPVAVLALASPIASERPLERAAEPARTETPPAATPSPSSAPASSPAARTGEPAPAPREPAATAGPAAAATAARRTPAPPSGRKPWQAHARPFDAQDKRPRVALIVVGLGLNTAVTESAIRELPGGVTLAFSPYADHLERWIEAARATAHEVLLALPMEPLSFPLQDPGPHTLLTTLTPKDNLDRLGWALGRASGYAGVIDTMGSRFVASFKDLAPVLAAIHERGLLFVDSGSAPDSVVARAAAQIGLPWTVSARTVDDRANRAAIDASLGELERLARQQGRALGVATPLPITLARVAEWAAKLEERGVVLAPASAMIRESAAG